MLLDPSVAELCFSGALALPFSLAMYIRHFQYFPTRADIFPPGSLSCWPKNSSIPYLETGLRSHVTQSYGHFGWVAQPLPR